MWYFWPVAASFAACSALWLAFFYFGRCSVEEGCSKVSLTHHFVAMVAGLAVHAVYHDKIGTHAAFAPNDQFPWAVLLQHFNLGYFFYDTIHVAVWDQRWLVHHIVAIAGFATSEYANVFGLANGVNAWITEIGSLLYSAYLIKRTDSAYLAFVVVYTASRIYFAYWSCQVLRQSWLVLRGKADFGQAGWTPYAAAALQVSLLLINTTFVVTHWQKLAKRLRKSRKGAHSAAVDGVSAAESKKED